jgi:hypothetical protein
MPRVYTFRARWQVLIRATMRARFALLGVLALSVPAFSNGQVTHTSTIVNDIGFASDKPFTAVRVTRSVSGSEDENKETAQRVDHISRDSSGRIRIEMRRTTDNVAAKTETETNGTANEELASQILIFDQARGRTVSILPGMHNAWVKETGDSDDSLAQSHPRAYSAFFTSLAGHQLPPGLVFEDLGEKNVAGIEAHGFKTTNLGTEKDGEWQGKPIRENEIWVSDDLALTLLRINTDFRAKSESRMNVLNIERKEPEVSLFEIPDGYKIDHLKTDGSPGMVNPNPAR